MSDTNSDDWVDSPNDSLGVDEDRQSEADNVNPSSVQQDEQQFPRRSVEEVEKTAYVFNPKEQTPASTHRRTSSLSSGIAAMSPTELASAQPRQPSPPPPPHSSTLPNQIEHTPDHDRNRSPKSSLPDYHNPDSPTQKRGKGVFRNPVADTWREDAYMKKEPTHQKMTAGEASKVQDRRRVNLRNEEAEAKDQEREESMNPRGDQSEENDARNNEDEWEDDNE
ncbi:unnamed protein product [Alternaria sp. RS040]